MTAIVDPSVSDRFLSFLRQLIRAEMPRLTFLGTYEYSVQATNGTTVDASPTDTSLSLPGLTKVAIRLPVGTSKPAVGSPVLIQFVNGDPTRPVCVAHDPSADLYVIGPTATSVQIGPTIPTTGNTLPYFAARVGDVVQAGPFTGAIVNGSLVTRVG